MDTIVDIIIFLSSFYCPVFGHKKGPFLQPDFHFVCQSKTLCNIFNCLTGSSSGTDSMHLFPILPWRSRLIVQSTSQRLFKLYLASFVFWEHHFSMFLWLYLHSGSTKDNQNHLRKRLFSKCHTFAMESQGNMMKFTSTAPNKVKATLWPQFVNRFISISSISMYT